MTHHIEGLHEFPIEASAAQSGNKVCDHSQDGKSNENLRGFEAGRSRDELLDSYLKTTVSSKDSWKIQV